MSNFLQSLIRVSELVILNSVVVVCLYAPPSSEAQTKQFDFPGRKEATSQSFPAKCEFDNLIIPANAKIYAAGAYSGRKLDFQIDSSGHQATQIDVAVNSPEAPVILMLGAYEPTVWNIGWSTKSTIHAVLVSGYHSQKVAGLSKQVPLLNSSYDNKGPCNHFYVTQSKLEKLNPLSRSLFGRVVDKVFLAKNGTVVVGEPLDANTELETSSDTPPESFYDKDAPLAGRAGLEKAVNEGFLRVATKQDMKNWLEARRKNSPKRDIPPVVGATQQDNQIPMMHNAYVVLKKFRIPAGLYGANSAVFLVAKGVPKPEGNPGHSTIFFLEDGSCSGVTCRMHQ